MLTFETALSREHECEAADRYSLWSGARDAAAQPFVPARTMPTDAERAAFAKSPRGRFLAALRELECVYTAEVERARSAYSRGFADRERPADPREVGVAIRALIDIAVPDARAAIAALAELLAQTPARAA